MDEFSLTDAILVIFTIFGTIIAIGGGFVVIGWLAKKLEVFR
jgi:hypothetical protein